MRHFVETIISKAGATVYISAMDTDKWMKKSDIYRQIGHVNIQQVDTE